jgi:YVTN family beta-propeller protein
VLPELPSGTVTFLFTDVEGSTRLLRQLREGYGEVLAVHHRLLRAAFEGAGGRETGTEGDAFFVAFGSARDAVGAAAAAQRALAAHPWPEGVEVRVRIGLHTGEPSMGEAGYHGMALHRAARISAAGHGGQVLLSSATRELIEDDLPAGLGLRDLGERRLKDLERPERIFQLTIDGLRNDFPPLKTLDPTPPAGFAATGRSLLGLRAVLAAVLAAAAAVAVVIPVFVLGGGRSGVAVGPNSVAAIDPKANRVVEVVPVGARPGAITFGSGALWVANIDDRSVSRIDVGRGRAEKAIAMDEPTSGLAAGGGAVWGVSASPSRSFASVRRIDPEFNEVVGQVTVRGSSSGAIGGAVAIGEGSIWAVSGGVGQLARIDPRTTRTLASIEAGLLPAGIAVGGGAVWVSDVSGNAVTRIDPKTNIVEETIRVGQGPTAIAYGAGAIWVALSLDDAVVRIDPNTNAPAARISVGDLPVAIAVGEGAVWVANAGDGSVARIDPIRNTVVKTIETGGVPGGVAVAAGRVWVTVAARASLGLSRPPGTARFEALSDAGTLDPALAQDPLALQVEYATCAKLLNYPDRPPPAGTRLEPEVAASHPVVSADRRTYTFTIRPGFRFSPPSNQPVTAQSFRYAIERSLSPRMRGPARGRLDEIVGAEAYQAGRASHIVGLQTQGSKLTVRLIAPTPDLPARLALPFFCAIPTNTPLDPRGVRTVSSAGPYYVASYVPGEAIVLKRNSNYGGHRPHRLKEIRVAISVAPAQSLVDVEAGRADYVLDGVPREAHARLSARYGPGSAAAKAGRQQYFVTPQLGVDFLVLNARRPLFASARLRRAVNYAVDRRALAPNDAFARGQPTDHYLPPGIPGYLPARIYPLTPDVGRARKIGRARAARAVLYTCDLLTCRQLAQIVKQNLKPIRIEVDVEQFPIPALLAKLTRRNEPYDIAVFGYHADLADSGAFLTGMLALPVLDLGTYGPRLAAAYRSTGRSRDRDIGRLANELARHAAPLVAFANPVRQDFFSRRIGCQTFNPLYGMDLAGFCIRP